MKLQTSLAYRFFCGLSVGVFILTMILGIFFSSRPIYADSKDSDNGVISDIHFVTIHDDTKSLTVKTTARTVGEALSRANIPHSAVDRIEPALTDVINSNSFHINIYRARPIIINHNSVRKYFMSASYDPKEIAKDAGLTLYDGDQLVASLNQNILESGVATVYNLVRNGGRTVTVEEDIPFADKTVNDASLPVGQTHLNQVGEVGRKELVYKVNFVNGQEVSRELINTTITKNPVDRITAVGMKKSLPPEWETCASYARSAGVPESELHVALTIIYRESGCRYDAANGSGAYGIPQALPGSKMSSAGADWQTNPVTQIRWMSKYVTGRYGGWSQAWAFWQSHHWY